MNLLIKANENQKRELLKKGFGSNAVYWYEIDEIPDSLSFDAFITLEDNCITIFDKAMHKPVLTGDESLTLKELPVDYIRINAWPGFLEKEIVEISTRAEFKQQAGNILDALSWKYTWAQDKKGMIGQRILSMIINEAYYALQENLSTREEIDYAMKLGTNYPFGPFEWAQKIGLINICQVLKAFAENDARYTICSILQEEAFRGNE